MYEDIVLELARIERRAYERVRERAAEQQLGEAWLGLAPGNEDAVLPHHVVPSDLPQLV